MRPISSTVVRVLLWTAKPRVQTVFNGWMTLLWLVMMPIVLVFIGPFSTVLWVSFISCWALFATHLGAWIAALVNVRAEELQGHATAATDRHADLHRKVDHLIRHLDVPNLEEVP